MADANGLRFWLLASEADWTAMPSITGQPAPEYDERRRTFMLGRYARVSFTETPTDAKDCMSRSRTATDAHGTFAFFDPDEAEVHGTGSAPGTMKIHKPSKPPTDMTVGADGVLYLIEDKEIVLVDLRDRWQPVRLSVDGFSPSRVTSAGDQGIWVLDKDNRRLGRVRGRPLPLRGLRVRAPDVFDPHEENPDPPRIVVLPQKLDALEDPIDLAASDDGRIAVLLWRGVQALVRFVVPSGAVSAAHVLGEIRRPYSLAWLDNDTLAVIVAALHRLVEGGPLVPGGTEVVTYLAELADEEVTRPPLGGVYPMPGHDGAPFARGVSSPVRYAVKPGPNGERGSPRKLVRVSATFRAAGGELRLDDDAPLDSGEIGFVWHRAYLEADFPASCGARLFVGASDTFGEPPAEFFEHIFGDIDGGPSQPRGVWFTQPSELPFHQGLVPCPIVPHRTGLFSVLLQRSTRRVSAVSGRYLWVRLLIEGNGHRTPEIAALRVYGSRFSYVEKYLPRVFHEQLVTPEADEALTVGARSEADFLERFLCNFEGILTPLEDRIANAHLLTDPSTVPSDALDWLGSWIGFVFDPAYPDEHRREALRNAMTLNRWRGTHRGLQMAIDILTGGRVVDGEMVGGAVTGGQVVLLEGWRLRRSFSTLLGVDLADENDPLLVDVTRSGNSRVGDSLILTQEHRSEFFALLRKTLPGDGPPAGSGVDEWISWYIDQFADQFAVQPFFDELAYRLVVLVHEDLGGDLVRLIERVVELEAPVHLETEVSKATYPFMVGLASLVGVDTYLRAAVPKPKITVEQSRLGARGFLSRPAALDRRLEGGP